MNYASTTSVSVEKSRAEIEKLIIKYGASQFGSMYDKEQAVVAFRMNGRGIKFTLPLPDKNSIKFTTSGVRNKKRSNEKDYKAWEQACRQKWRALLLCIKAKLNLVS